MHFKNYKLSELYILQILTILHPSQLRLFNLYSALRHRHHQLVPHLSLPLSRFARCPTMACVPTHHHRRHNAPTLGPPRRLRQLARRHDSGSHLSPFSSSFFSMQGHNTFVYVQQMEQDKAPTEAISTFTIYHANKQGTHAACMYH
jgi:hypothetical protein